MSEDDQLELMSNIHGLFVSSVHLTGRMMVLESAVEALVAQQREMLVRMGCDPSGLDAAFEKAKSDAFSRLSAVAATQINTTAAQERQRRRKK